MNSERFKLMATRLIRKYGQVCTWNVNRITPNAEQPWEPEDLEVDSYQVEISFHPIGKELKRHTRFKDDEVPEGIFAGYMAHSSFIPSIKDTVTRGSKELRINDIDIVEPDGNPIMYIIYFKD